jgi:hypothetical protein
MSFCPAKLDRRVLAFDISAFLQAIAKRGDIGRVPLRRGYVEEYDHWHRLLRTRHTWLRHYCAANKRDEITPPHAAP